MKLLVFITFACLATTNIALAIDSTYEPLVTIPGLSSDTGSVEELINALYALSIAIAALLAVIKIVIAGMKWMLTDVVTSKSEAKREMTGALTGLLVILSAVLILSVINPNLTKVDLTFTSTPSPAPGNPPAPVLDTSLIQSSPPVSMMPLSAPHIQRTLFDQSCQGITVYPGGNEGPRCIAGITPDKSVRIISTPTPPRTNEEACSMAHQTTDFVVDPFNPNLLHCVI